MKIIAAKAKSQCKETLVKLVDRALTLWDRYVLGTMLPKIKPVYNKYINDKIILRYSVKWNK